MPTPKNISTLKSFLASVQFYSKFLPPYFSEITEPLYKLTRKGQQWKWGEEESTSFKKIKRLLCTETVLAHYDPSLPLGLSCDASECGIGAVLFHRFADGSERPILNISKILSATQRRYSQIQKEALSLVYALKKFHQFLYGRKFIVVTDHKPLVTLFAPDKGTPAMAANRLARWALLVHQYDYTVEYRRSKDHGNADALSRLPFSNDTSFDGEEMEDDVDSVCLVRTISRQINPDNPLLVVRETAKDPILSQLMRFVKEGWPHAFSEELKDFKKLENLLSTENGCVFYGLRVIIPSTLRNHILKLLHLGHFGMQRMKQLARSTVYWPRIDFDIENLCRKCTSCGQFQNKPDKPSIHPWMMPEKPWSRLHLDHAINFLGRNWLVLVDAYSKYPCIHPTTSTSSKSTTAILEQEFAHFGYPHTLVTDNATTFMSQEFQAWCKQRGIVHLTGAPYHPATNGAAERLIQSFKQALRKSSLPPKEALQEFLMQYRRIPFASGLSPSKLLNGRRIRTKIDTLVPSIPHLLQGRQSRQASKHSNAEDSEVVSKVSLSKVNHLKIFKRNFSMFSECDFLKTWKKNLTNNTLGKNKLDPDKDFLNFLITFLNCLETHTPTQKLTRKETKFYFKPWLTKSMQNSIKKKNKLYQLSSQHAHSEPYYKKYKQYNNTLTKVKQSKQNYFQHRLQLSKNNTKETWKTINQIIRKPIHHTTFTKIKCIDTNIDLYDPKHISSCFNKYFSSVRF